jgi:hypothetical protein
MCMCMCMQCCAVLLLLLLMGYLLGNTNISKRYMNTLMHFGQPATKLISALTPPAPNQDFAHAACFLTTQRNTQFHAMLRV